MLAALLVGACQAPQGDSSAFTTTPPPPPEATSGGETSSGETSSGTSSESTGGETSGASTGAGTTGTVLDVGSTKDLGGATPPGCKGKIDFLFVISRYTGMSYFQEQLSAAFPQFIATIEEKFADFDYHIMVVDGDDDWGAVTCEEMCPAPCEPGYPCWYLPTGCDTTMGAGVRFPAGWGAANDLCAIDGGRRYMIKEQTALAATFSCVAALGHSGYDLIGEALTAAVQPGINQTGGCNGGFLRDDALLMVTLISNTVDYPNWSKGTPATWAAALRDAKHGDPASIVMLSVLRDEPECHEWDRTCQLVKMFPHHLLGDIEAPDYGAYFEQAAGLVEVACESFVPPG
jgi:hypothetical protein